MPDSEMAPGEIARILKEIKQQLTHVIGRREYDADQRHTDSRFLAIEQDMKEVKDDVAELKKQPVSERRRTDDRRLLIIVGFVAPIVTGIVLTALLAALRL